MSLTLLSPPTRSAPLTVRVARVAGRSVVVLAGEADVATTAVLSDALARVVASHGGDVVVDLGALDFVDTATVRVLATAHYLLAGQGRALTIRTPSRLGRRLLDLFGLADLITPGGDTAA
jgi:anti-anti-sigma factor